MKAEVSEYIVSGFARFGKVKAKLWNLRLAKMLGADLRSGKEAEKWSAIRGCFHGGPAIGFLAFNDADHGGDDHPCFTGSFYCVNRRGAGGANIVDNHHARACTTEALNAASRAVRLFRLADEKAMQQGCGGVGLRAPGACRGNVAHDWVRAHGESAHGFRVDSVFLQKLKHGVAGEAAAFSVQGGGAAIDVIIAGSTGGKLELAEAEAGAGEKREKLLGVRLGGHRF